jgi:hypothetical protein
MNFNLNANQHGTLVVQPIDAQGNPASATEIAGASDDPTVITVAPHAGFPNELIVTAQGKAGVNKVTVTGKDSNGNAISTVFNFTIADPAVGFSAQLINVANN